MSISCETRILKAAHEGANALTADETADLEKIASQVATLAKVMQGLGYNHTNKSLEALARFSLGYGIGITGGVGTGKTYFFETLKSALQQQRKKVIYLPYKEQARYNLPQLEIVRLREFAGDQIEEIYKYFGALWQTDIVFDDLGCEGMFNDYGERFFLISMLLDYRCRCNARTCWTTNLDGDGLLSYYDDVRIIDRLKAVGGRMIQFDGGSRRKAVRRKGLFVPTTVQ